MPTNKNQSKQANYSLERNGTGQYVQSDNIPFNSGPSWTISCWVKGANLTSGTTEAFYGTQYYGTTTGGFVIYFKNGGLTFYSSLPGSGSYFTIATATGLLSNNEWQQFVIRYNYGVDYRVYVNNVLRGVNTLNNTKIWPEQNIRLFRHYANDGYSYIGEMTDWCFFNYALSDTSTTVGDTATDQVAAIYGDGSSLPNPMALPNPPIAYYPLGTSAWNGANYLVPNNSLQDYVFQTSPSGGKRISIPSITITSAATISIWVNIIAFTGGTQQVILGDQNTTKLVVNNQGGFVRVIYSGASGFGVLTTNLVTSDFINKWHHIALVQNGGAATVYINNINKGNISGTLRMPDFAVIGALANGVIGLNGFVSNVALFSTNLPATGTESIASLYNNGSPPDLTSYSNLQRWYKLNAQDTFDGSNWTINDYAGSNDGTSVNMTSANLVQSNLQYTSGYSPYALDFDGTNDYIPLNSNINLTGDRTISFWVNLNSTASAFLFASNNNDYYPLITASSVLIRSTAEGSTSFSQPNIVIGVWYHYCITGDGTNATLYRDGVLIDTGTDRSPIINTIGASATGAGPVNAKMSNVAIWTNTVLSQPEVTEIYNQGVPSNLNNFSGTAPTHWWQLGENSSFDGNNWICADEKGTNNGDSTGMGVDALTNGVGTTANGVSSGMGVEALVGDAPYSTANAISLNMSVLAKGTDPADIPS